MSRSARGVSLVELLVALALGLLVVAGMIALFSFAMRHYGGEQKLARLDDEARFALQQLTADLQMAGFWSTLADPETIAVLRPLVVGADCGPPPAPGASWTLDERSPYAFFDAQAGGSIAAAFPCIGAASAQPGADAVAVRHVAGAIATSLTANRVYLRSNGLAGLLYRAGGGGAGTAIARPYTDREYQPAVYYVQRSTVGTDHVPGLCREVLNAGPQFQRECIATGIENLQLEWGVDADGDGRPDGYVAQPTAAQLAAACSAKVYLLARSAEPDPHYRGERSFVLGNLGEYTPSGAARRYHRRLLSAVVRLRNRAAPLGPAS